MGNDFLCVWWKGNSAIQIKFLTDLMILHSISLAKMLFFHKELVIILTSSNFTILYWVVPAKVAICNVFYMEKPVTEKT